MENKKYSCVDCIWRDQCESNMPCDFFDKGTSGGIMTDSEVEIRVEQGRLLFKSEYQKYIKEFGGQDYDRN